MFFFSKQRPVFSQKIKKLVTIFFLGVLLVNIFCLPSVALDREILDVSSQNMSNIEQWWDKLWETTFDPPPIESNPNSVGDVTSIENPKNLSLYAFVFPTRFILMIGLTAWLCQYGYKMYEAKGVIEGSQLFFQLFLPFFIAVMLLSNYGQSARVLAYGLRDITNFWSQGVMDLTIADFNVRTAIQDQLVTEDAKEEIVKQWEECEALPQPEVAIPAMYRPSIKSDEPKLPPSAENPPSNGGTEESLPPPPPLSEAQELPITLEQRQVYDYLDCLRELSYFAEAKLNEAEDSRRCGGFICQTFKNLYLVFSNVATVTYEEELTKRLEEDVLNSPTTQSELEKIKEDRLDPDSLEEQNIAAENFAVEAESLIASLSNPSKPMLYFTQWMYISTLELAMFLSALIAPIFVAMSIIPGKQNMLQFWLIEVLTIGIAKLIYVVVIGIVAVQRADPSNFATVMDHTFFLSLGIFAPAVSFVLASVGGIAAASSFRGQAIGSIAMVAGVFSGAAATIGYSMARNYDKKR